MSVVKSLADLAAYEEAIAEMAVDWADPDSGRMNWDDFLGRVERYLEVALPDKMDDPVIRRVQKVARAAVAESRL